MNQQQNPNQLPLLKVNSDKILLLADIHWGKSRDSQIKIESLEHFFDFVIQYCTTNNIHDIIFLGDWFDNRNAICVKTINHSYSILKKFEVNNINIIMILGNHDTYYKDSIVVNSLKPLSDIKNITVIMEPTEIDLNSNYHGIMYPWNTFNKSDKIYDISFGHYEFQGARLTGTVNNTGNTGEDITAVSKLAFSGHFHLRNEYEFVNGKIVCVGTPLQLDWGDYNNAKGFYVLNTKDLAYEFVPNAISPLYKKIYWSDVLNRNKDAFANISGNYIKLVIDKEYEFDKIIKLVNYINSQNPIRPCEPEFLYSTALNDVISEDGEYDEKIITMSQIDQLNKYIDSSFANNALKDLDIVTVKKMCWDYYQKAMVNE